MREEHEGGEDDVRAWGALKVLDMLQLVTPSPWAFCRKKLVAHEKEACGCLWAFGL